MTTGGWIIMIASVGFVTSLFAWCIWRVLSTPGSSQRLHADTNIKPTEPPE